MELYADGTWRGDDGAEINIQDIRNASPGFANILAEYKIRNIYNDADGTWIIESNSGSTYRSNGDRCNCPARYKCRHLNAIQQVRYGDALMEAQHGESDAIEAIERGF